MKRKAKRAARSVLDQSSSLYARKQALSSSRLDAVFSALSDPTRRAMVDRLSQGEASVGELAKPFQISLPAITKHLHVLEGAGLLSREREGRVIKLHLDPNPLIATTAWMEEYRGLWETQLNSLSAYLENLHEERAQ